MEKEKIVKMSPFCYYPGIEAVLENKRKSCNAADIKSAFNKEHFRDIDVYIVKTVFDYDVINKNALTFCLNNSSEVPEVYKKGDYTRNIHNLVERGILLRYSFRVGDKSSPCIYTLSKGALQYFSRMFGRGFNFSHRSNPFISDTRPESFLRMVSFNQFFIRLIKSNLKMKRVRTDVKLNYKKQSLYLDAYIRFCSVDNKDLDFIFLCFRNTEDMKETVNAYLEAICHHYSRSLPTVVLIVESLNMAKEIEIFKITKERFRNLSVFYLPDTVAISEEPMSLLYSIEPGNNFSKVNEYSFALAKK